MIKYPWKKYNYLWINTYAVPDSKVKYYGTLTKMCTNNNHCLAVYVMHHVNTVSHHMAASHPWWIITNKKMSK